MTMHIVRAKQPTVLEGQPYYALSPNDLWMCQKIDTAHIVPGAIDMGQFKDALAKTLQAYPVHAGRIVRPTDPKDTWKVSLGNHGVPVAVIESDAEKEVPNDTIVQSPWTLTRGVNVIKYLDYDSDEPLVKVTITRFTRTGNTCIGISLSHLIGDGFAVLSFIRLLSQNYQGLEPLDPLPSYDPIPHYPFNPADYGEVPAPPCNHSYPLRGVPPPLEPRRERAVRLDIRLAASQTVELHKGVLAQCLDPNPPILSRQDCLAALLVYCTSKSDPENPPIQHVYNILMTRGIVPRPKHCIGNFLLWPMTDAAEDFDKETLFTIALRIRNSLIRLREPGYAAASDAASGAKAVEFLNAELAQDFRQRPGHMVVNSNWRFDWTSAHFGFPDQTRFYHTILNEPRFVKIFRPNPTRQPDGTWSRRHKDDIEITFYVHKEHKDAFKEIFTSKTQLLGMSGDIEWVDVV